MIEEERRALEPELGGKVLDEAFADHRGAKGAAAFADQGSHWIARQRVDANMSERMQIGMDVEIQAVVGDPVADGDADAGDEPAVGPDAGTAPMCDTADTEVAKDGEGDLLELFKIGLNSPAPAIERDDRINGQLAGQVQHAATAAVNPANRPAAILQFGRLVKDVRAAAVAAD